MLQFINSHCQAIFIAYERNDQRIKQYYQPSLKESNESQDEPLNKVIKYLNLNKDEMTFFNNKIFK